MSIAHQSTLCWAKLARLHTTLPPNESCPRKSVTSCEAPSVAEADYDKANGWSYVYPMLSTAGWQLLPQRGSGRHISLPTTVYPWHARIRFSIYVQGASPPGFSWVSFRKGKSVDNCLIPEESYPSHDGLLLGLPNLLMWWV